jgi:hypothetical protein
MQVRQQVVTLGPDPAPTWDRVTPVISTAVALVPLQSRLTLSGRALRLVVTFVEQDSAGVKRVVGVTGFTSADVSAVAMAPDGSDLTTAVTISPVATTAYEVTMVPVADMWSQDLLVGCKQVALSVSVASGSAVTVEGNPTEASSTLALDWLPGGTEQECNGAGNSKKGQVGTACWTPHAACLLYDFSIVCVCRDIAPPSSQQLASQA